MKAFGIFVDLANSVSSSSNCDDRFEVGGDTNATLDLKKIENAYDQNFIGDGVEVPLPEIPANFETEIVKKSYSIYSCMPSYTHYSLVICKSKKQALFSAINLNQSQLKVSILARKCFANQKIGETSQALYIGDQKPSKRSDITVYLQHENFNQNFWGLPEEAIFNFTEFEDNKFCVITGPIFPNYDLHYGYEIKEYVQAPSGFWKLISFLSKKTNSFVTTVFLIYQDSVELSNKFGLNKIKLETYQVSTAMLEKLTGLCFHCRLKISNPIDYLDSTKAYLSKSQTHEMIRITNIQSVVLTHNLFTDRESKIYPDLMGDNQITDMGIWQQAPSVPSFGVAEMYYSKQFLIMNILDDKRFQIMGESNIKIDLKNNFILDPRMNPEEFDRVHIFATSRAVLLFCDTAFKRVGISTPIQWEWENGIPLTIYTNLKTDKHPRYSRNKKALKFYHFNTNKKSKVPYNCRPLDEIAHVTGHAILDSLRPDYWNGNEPETLGFHESFSDMVLMFTLLGQMEICERVILETNGNLHTHNYFSLH